MSPAIFQLSSYSINLWAMPIACAVLILASLSLKRFYQWRLERTSLTLNLLTFFILIWLVSAFFGYSATNAAVAFWWAKAAYLGVPFIAPAFYLFVITALNVYKKHKRLNALIWVLFLLFPILIIGTDLVFSKEKHFPWGYSPQFTLWSIMYLIPSGIVLGMSYHKLLLAYKREIYSPKQRLRIRSFLLAFGIGGGAVVDYLASFDIAIYPAGYMAILVSTVILSRALVKYKLIDITPTFAAQGILDTMDEALITIDAEGIIRLINRAATVMLGRPEKDLLGRPFTMIFGEGTQPVLDGSASSGPVHCYELSYAHPDGGPQILSMSASSMKDDSGSVIATVCTVRNITDSKRTMEELQKLSQALRQSASAVTITDTEGRIEFVNPQFEKVTGYSASEVLGKHPMMFRSGIHPAEFYSDIFETLRAGHEWVGEICNRNKKGDLYWEHASIAPVLNQEGKTTHYILVNEDITERKQIEEALKKAKVAAEAANMAKSEFLANMSHEIRTPMNGIMGMTGLLLDTGLSGEQRNYAEMLRSSGELLLGLLNDILDFSKIEAGKLEIETIEFDLRNTLEETAEFMALRAHEKGLELVCRIDPGVHIFLIGDPGRLRQILVNLIGNAIKFTREGEVVIEAVTEYETDGQVAVRFNIRDTGIGIAEDKISLLFDSFQQVDASTSRKFGGSGLGLAISRRLVELMNGKIGVESIEGQGSNFWFTAVFDKGSPPDRGDMPPLADISGVRILAVEDNAVNRIVIAEQMRSWGVRHAEAEGGLKAMEMLHAAHAGGDPFRVVITDMQMPGMNGEALARAIKADPALKDTLLVMLTSSGMRGDSKRLASLGFAAYLTKPVRMFQLHDCIAAVLGGSSLDEKAREATIITRHRLREASRGDVRILLVEDNKVNKMVAEGILGKLGFSADTADNGRQAIDMLEAASYDIVFMDVQMPVMDGYQATRAIRGGKTKAANPKVPIIAMTAHAMKGDREKCLQGGMDDYISKPISPRKLAKALEKWLPQAPAKLPPTTDMTPGKTAAVGALPVFDYPGLMERIMDDMDLARRVIAAFMEGIPRMLDELREQIVRGDAELAGRQAHKIKGAAANTGFMAMSAIAADMQKAGEKGQMETIIALMPELESQLELVKAEIKDSGVLEA